MHRRRTRHRPEPKPSAAHARLPNGAYICSDVDCNFSVDGDCDGA